MFPVCTASIKRGRTMDYAIPVVATAALVVSAAAALALIAVAALFAEALAVASAEVAAEGLAGLSDGAADRNNLGRGPAVS